MIDATPLLLWLAESSLKASAVALIVVLLQALLGHRLPARWRHALWLLVVIRLLMPAVPQSALSLHNLLPNNESSLTQPMAVVPPDSSVRSIASSATLHESSTRLSSQQWLMLSIAGLWLSVALTLFLRHVLGSVRLQRSIARTARALDPRLIPALRRAQREAGVRTPIRVVVTDAVSSPALHGLLRPSILIPYEVAESFSDDELHHVILHELSHLKRGDAWINGLVALASSMHWFNPLIWFAAARIREERELVCDELALSCLEEDERGLYGRTLLRLLERFRAPASVPALVGIADPGKYMKRRIQMIASYRKSRSIPYLFAALVAGVAAVGFTDAKAGERVHIRRMMHGNHAQMDKLHERATFSLTNASLSDLITAVSNATGAVITLAPDAAQSKAGEARFDVSAVNAPAFLILVESLQEFQLAPVPAEDGSIQITSAPDHHMIRARVEAKRGDSEEIAVHVDRVVVTSELRGPGAEEIEVTANGRHQALVQFEAIRTSEGAPAEKVFNFTYEEEGVKSEGSLRIEVRQ